VTSSGKLARRRWPLRMHPLTWRWRLSEPNLRETARLIEERGGRALGVRRDVTRVEEVKGALDRTIEAFLTALDPATML